MYVACQCVRRLAPIILNNVSLCALSFIPKISGLLRQGVLNPGRRLASWMRYNQYTTRASRNEVSNVRAFELGLHSTQVPTKSCRKWHRIYILVRSQSPLYMAHTTLR